MTAQARAGSNGGLLGVALLAGVLALAAALPAAGRMTAAMDAAQPIPEQPTVIVPAPAMPYFTGFGTALLLADTTTMQVPVGAMWPSGHAKAKHGLAEVARIHKAFMALPAAYVAKYKTPCSDGMVRIPVPLENGEYGLEVLEPIAEGLYRERTAFIPWLGWKYISDVLNDCHNGQGGAATSG